MIEKSQVIKTVNKEVLYHLGIILDGNRRWAKSKNLPAIIGHNEGKKRVKEVCRWCKAKGIKIITLYAFSTENWERSLKEVKFLIKLIEMSIREDMKEIHREGYKIKIIGEKDKLPKSFQKVIKEAEELTKDNKGGILNLAISYGGRLDIVQAVKKIIKKGISPDDVTEKMIDKNLWTADVPHPNLIIRTSGEQRLSGFLTWQSAYSELYFSKKLWPDFTEKDLDKALKEYAQRQRRFGK
ncbi:MAG TPA: polyprenyl diphosphate synthase [Candidatus Parcubacteria bacterium]|jgi:undecaprenyl diphosphate synthase|nr:di-trans,poly-cis-decaprenylcistransferase [Parcubacteria group bacterium]HJN62129.1 polyprenyl diphosphate synthase [Candidatus Parcubacteria bacterium]|tara:strand:+ start:33684 stop:34403 length:720 start_codon:yes stop_codon:yes gene_type:complete